MRQLLLLALIYYSVAAKCPFGSIYSEKYQTCYLVSSMNSPWATSECVCNVLGGHLASIHSKDQSDYIISLVYNTSKYNLYSNAAIGNIWLGVKNAQNIWMNTDGSPVNYTAFTDLCDAGWSVQGYRCVQTNGQQKSWQDARNVCSNLDAFIVDDLTDDQHNSLFQMGAGSYFWIGLYNHGNGYYWDQGPGSAPIPLNQTNQYWVGGGAAPPYDPNRQCVFFDATQTMNTWTLGDCAQMSYFMCQKDRYDQNNAPNRQTYVQMSTNGSTIGQWALAKYDSQTNYFVCELPQCGSGGTSPVSLIAPGTKVNGIVYGNMTEAWYMHNLQPPAFVTAEPLCAMMGAHLPSVGNAFKNAELLNIAQSMGNREFPLGYRKRGDKWAWTDGNTATYTNWDVNEPDLSQGSAMFNAVGGLWDCSGGTFSSDFICEINPLTRAGWC